MRRIRDLQEVNEAASTDDIILETADGTRRISAENLQKGKANKSTLSEATIPASGWSGESTPYSNTISVEGVTADNNVELVLPADVTAEQIEGYQTAQILNAAQSEGSLTLYAWGEIPTVDLPMTVIVRGD